MECWGIRETQYSKTHYSNTPKELNTYEQVSP